MSDDKSSKAQVLRGNYRSRCMIVVLGTLLVGTATAAPANIDVVRDLAGRVGPIIGSALACTDIARPRIQTVVDKFVAVIRETASTSETDRADLTLVLDRSVAEGRAAVGAGRADCKTTDRQLGRSRTFDLGPTPPGFAGPSGRRRRSPPHAAPVSTCRRMRGMTDRKSASGSPRRSPAQQGTGRQMKLGIDSAFNRVNDAGGVEGRMLRLVPQTMATSRRGPSRR